MMAADPEMERLEKQLQQSVDTFNTFLAEPSQKKKKREGEKKGQKTMAEQGEEGARDSLSEGEDNQSEEELLDKQRPPSLSDQMSLLSPGPQQPPARELSPADSLQEELLSSTSQPVPITPSPAVATSEAKSGSAPTSTTFSTPVPGASVASAGTTSTKSSPGTAGEQETSPRPRSQSCDSRSSKPLMIPSNTPPWLEMVGKVCVCIRMYIHVHVHVLSG